MACLDICPVLRSRVVFDLHPFFQNNTECALQRPGWVLSKGDYEYNDEWRRVINVITAILGTVSLPVTSSICARGAVVYLQKSKDYMPPKGTMRQMMALADKGWMDFEILKHSLLRRPHSVRSSFLFYCAALCGISGSTYTACISVVLND